MVFLETDRLILRNVAPDDAVEMHEYRNHPLCSKYQRGQTKDLVGIQTLIHDHISDILSADRPCLLAAAQKETDKIVGEIVVMPSDETFSLGYTISYKHHRKGYAFESLSTLIEYLHLQYPSWDFVCFTDEENAPSRALLEKLGYEDLGYISTKASEIYGKWITETTKAEIAQIVDR